LTTRHAQLLKWSSLILSYCRHFRIYKLSLVDAVESDLFYNKRIGKKLGINDLREVLEFMRKDGRIERVGAGKEIGIGRGEEGGLVWVWWRTPEEWGGALYDWVSSSFRVVDLGGEG
jgi:ESCRT-II complex subunit VPS25